ncbi:MAG: MipA/OmpV family protein [Pseudomonadota bacterium]
MMKLRHMPLLCAAFIAAPAIAQDAPAASPPPSPEDITNRDTLTIAAGGAMFPDYEGSNDYRFIPALGLRGQYHGFSFTTRGLYLYVDVIPDSNAKVEFDAGPIAGVRFNRTRKKLKDDVVDLLPVKKTAFEAGAFVGVTVHGVTNPYGSLAFRVDVLRDFASAHKSTIVSPNVDFSTPLSQTTFVSASLGAEFVSNKFADYYFSIDPSESLVTGLPTFNAGGGMKNWKAGLLVNQSLSGSLLHGLSAFGTVNYSRLVGDFKRSPIVSDRGSANQWLLAAGLAYTW